MKFLILILSAIIAVNTAGENLKSIYIAPDDPGKPWQYIPTNDPYDIFIIPKQLRRLVYAPNPDQGPLNPDQRPLNPDQRPLNPDQRTDNPDQGPDQSYIDWD